MLIPVSDISIQYSRNVGTPWHLLRAQGRLIPSRHELRMTFVLCSLVALRLCCSVRILSRAHRLLYYVSTQLFSVQRPFPQVLVKSTAARSLSRHPVVIVLLWLPSVSLGRKNHLDLLLSLLLEFNFNKIFLSFEIVIGAFCN